MRYMTVCLLMCLVSAAPDRVVKQKDFDGEKPKEVKLKVIKEEMTIKQGESFSVKLESNPSTGFSWRLLGPDYGPLTLKKTHFQKAENDAKAGAPGVQIFEFAAKKKDQQIVLVFNYGRAFEGLGHECYELKVKVEE